MKQRLLTPQREAAFWDKVREDAAGCWLWTASRTQSGYGRFCVDGPIKYAHRIAYELLVAAIPAGLQLDHLCRVRDCVNPYHCDPVPSRINTLRGTSPFARNAAKTHCVNGHEFTAETAYQHPTRPGTRDCLTCRNARNAGRKHKGVSA